MAMLLSRRALRRRLRFRTDRRALGRDARDVVRLAAFPSSEPRAVRTKTKTNGSLARIEKESDTRPAARFDVTRNDSEPTLTRHSIRASKRGEALMFGVVPRLLRDRRLFGRLVAPCSKSACRRGAAGRAPGGRNTRSCRACRFRRTPRRRRAPCRRAASRRPPPARPLPLGFDDVERACFGRCGSGCAPLGARGGPRRSRVANRDLGARMLRERGE